MSDDKGAVEEIMQAYHVDRWRTLSDPKLFRTTVERVIGEKDAEIAALRAEVERLQRTINEEKEKHVL